MKPTAKIQALLDAGILEPEDIRNKIVSIYAEEVVKGRFRGRSYTHIRTRLVNYTNKAGRPEEADRIDEAIDHIRILRGEEGME